MKRTQAELFERFSANGGERHLTERFGGPQISPYGLRPATGDYHKTMKTWYEGDECRARILVYRNSPPGEDQIVIRRYLDDYCD